MMRSYKKQRGIALLTAMIITAIAVSVAATLAYRQQISLRLAINLAHIEQAHQYVIGMESWVKLVLAQDKKDSKIDALDEDWAKYTPSFPIEGGTVSGRLEDLQAKFNVNTLMIQDENTKQEKINAVQQQRLLKLLQHLTLDAALSNVMIDWIDKDNNVMGGNGAESDYYIASKPVYMTGNAPMVDVSELRLLKGVDNKIYNTLTKHITMLPVIVALAKNTPTTAGNDLLQTTTSININTASESLLIALGLTETEAQDVISKRKEKAFESIAEFSMQVNANKEDKAKIDVTNLSVASQYFALKGVVEISKIRVFINSVFFRDDKGKVRVVYRNFSKNNISTNTRNDKSKSSDHKTENKFAL